MSLFKNILLAAGMLLPLTACGDDEGTSQGSEQGVSVIQMQTVPQTDIEYAAFLDRALAPLSKEDQSLLLRELETGFELHYEARTGRFEDIETDAPQNNSLVFEKMARPALEDVGFDGVRKLGMSRLIELEEDDINALTRQKSKLVTSLVELKVAAENVKKVTIKAVAKRDEQGNVDIVVTHNGTDYDVYLADLSASYPGSPAGQRDVEIEFDIRRGSQKVNFSTKLDASLFENTDAVTLDVIDSGWKLGRQTYPSTNRLLTISPNAIDDFIGIEESRLAEIDAQISEKVQTIATVQKRLSSIS